MADPGGRTDPDPDDWFAEPDAPRAQTVTPAPAEDPPTDDWLVGPGALPRPGRVGGASPRVRLLAVGVALAVLLLGGLAVAGVFSGSHHPAAAPPETRSTAATSTARVRTTTQPTTRQPLPAPTATLQNGDTGAQVSVLQRALLGLGYATGAVDGFFGPKTAAAVTAFQQASGLTADAIVGPLTRAALVAALARSASG